MGESENKSLIFTETKRRADELTRRMRRDGYMSFLFLDFTFHGPAEHLMNIHLIF